MMVSVFMEKRFSILAMGTWPVLSLFLWVAGCVSPGSDRLFAAPVELSLPLGQVLERVYCQGDSTQGYALFLPSTYRPDRPWPILYAFDPGARGAIPVRLFGKAAERLGYIVAASNNARNGPGPPIKKAIEAVWHDTHARLNLDPARIYTTGMSGGTSPALMLAEGYGSGIIACAGAILPEELVPEKIRFAWFGIAGDADFNYDLTRSVVEKLVSHDVRARFATFEGGHDWPPEDLASYALEWLELMAMQAGRIPRNTHFIDDQFQRRSSRVNDLKAAGKMQEAAEECEAMSRDFSGLKTVEEFSAEAGRLYRLPEASRMRKQSRTRSQKEKLLLSRLENLRLQLERFSETQSESYSSRILSDPPLKEPYGGEESYGSGSHRQEILFQIQQRVSGLEHDRKAKNSDTRLVAVRVLDAFYIGTYYLGWERRERNQFEAALADFAICALMRPKSPVPVYETARTHARRNEQKKALAELRRALKMGFGDRSRLVEDPEWDSLRSMPDFQGILGGLEAKSPTKP